MFLLGKIKGHVEIVFTRMFKRRGEADKLALIAAVMLPMR